MENWREFRVKISNFLEKWRSKMQLVWKIESRWKPLFTGVAGYFGTGRNTNFGELERCKMAPWEGFEPPTN